MSKFANAFSGLNKGSGNSDPNAPKIDWEKINNGLVDLFDTKEKAKSRVGVISGIIDLGLQPMDDGHKKSDVAVEDEADFIDDNPNNYFDDYTDPVSKKTERHVFWKQKAQRAVAITVDFPQYQFDYEGEVGVKPVRFLLNGDFVPKGQKAWDVVVGRTYDLRETTKDFDPKWSLAKNSLLYKLALATEVIKPNEPFSKGRIGELIGKHALFEARLWLDGGYLQERISFKGEVPEGMNKPEVDEDTLYFINLDEVNEEQHVKQLRRAVKNTIKRSESYEGSKLQEQFDSVLFPVYNKDETKTEDKAPEPVPAPVTTGVEFNPEDDAPF